MKKFLVPLLALLLSHAPSFAQSQLVFRIDQDAQTVDWVDGFSITAPVAPLNGWFGSPPTNPNLTLTSPLPDFSGPGTLTEVRFQITSDFGTQRFFIRGIDMITTYSEDMLSPRTLSGTAEGPVTPDNFSAFALLERGEYTFHGFYNWGGTIQVVVVPEPATWAFLGLGVGAVALVRARRLRAAR